MSASPVTLAAWYSMFVGQCTVTIESFFGWGAEHVIIVGIQVRTLSYIPI
jgi:hypothetical protein